MNNTTTVSPKFQVVIPKNIREKGKISPGNKFHVVLHNGSIQLVPLRSVEEMKGRFKGKSIDTSLLREKSDSVIY